MEENNNVASEAVKEVVNNEQQAAPVVDQTKESGVWDEAKYRTLALAANRDNPLVNSGLPQDFTGMLRFTELAETFQEVKDKTGKVTAKWVPVTAISVNDNMQYTVSLSKVFRLNGKWSSTKATERIKQLHKAIMANTCTADITDGSWDDPTPTRTFVRKNLKGEIFF